MLEHRRKTRDYLKKLDRPTFLEIVYRAKVTPRQKEILYRRFLDYHSRVKISEDLILSVDKVGDEIAEGYDQIYHYLKHDVIFT